MSSCRAFVMAWATVLVVGCGSDLPPMAEVNGVVTLNGEPVEGAKVMFIPQDGGARFSHGTTDADGRFELSTFSQNDGALIGKHKVTVSKMDLPEEAKKIDVQKMQEEGIVAGMPSYGKMMGHEGKDKLQPQNQIPAKYSDPASTPWEFEVTESGPNEFELKVE